MYQPNYHELDFKLKEAIAWCERNADSLAAQYRQSLVIVLRRFTEATDETNALHTEWRRTIGEQLTAGKAARLAWDKTYALADEHGYDDFPSTKIAYMEPDLLLKQLDHTSDWLSNREGQWDWIAEQEQDLKRRAGDFIRNRKHADDLYLSYTVVVKKRVTAYDDAVATLKEFVRDVRLSGGTAEDVRRFDIAFH